MRFNLSAGNKTSERTIRSQTWIYLITPEIYTVKKNLRLPAGFDQELWKKW
jgi:hypothetical protein